jgi:hypothetical protein
MAVSTRNRIGGAPPEGQGHALGVLVVEPVRVGGNGRLAVCVHFGRGVAEPPVGPEGPLAAVELVAAAQACGERGPVGVTLGRQAAEGIAEADVVPVARQADDGIEVASVGR